MSPGGTRSGAAVDPPARRARSGGLGAAARAWASDALRVLLPRGCVACGGWMPEGPEGADLLTCATCRSRLRPAPWPRCPRCHFPSGTGRVGGRGCRECAAWTPDLSGARWAWLLQPPADDLVHGLKYGGWTALAEEMGRAVAQAVSRMEADVVVPVPTTSRRIRERGYNQADLLAAVVARTLGLHHLDALARTRDGPTQVALPPSRRRANVRGAFAVRDGAFRALRGARVLLVDDVLTTGSTAGAAAGELARAGAASVTLATFARALPYRR